MSIAAAPDLFTESAGRRDRIAAKSLRERLREATAQAHAGLDRQFASLDLRNRGEYRCFLAANAGALLPIEDALVAAGVERMFPDWPLRSRRRAIGDDLARLGGVALPLIEVTALDQRAVLGTMYVLEGSRLGARLLLKTVLTSPDPAVADATNYLAHGAREHFWKSFLPILEHHGEGLADDKAAIEGARDAFAIFSQAAQQVCGPGKSPPGCPSPGCGEVSNRSL